ncbi:MAG: putative kynurenine formamidase [Deltaproteobacteria bacterium]|nr:putative kynurenine formamidase [Deltaproteobacteria bacterium]
MKFLELTMPLNHQWMPDDVLPTSVKFFLGPKNHQEKGMVIGSDSGTCLTLPSVFEAFRKTARLDEVPVDKLVLRSTTVVSIAKSEGEEINKTDVQKAFDAARPAKGDAILIATGWGDKPCREFYLLGSPHLSLEAAQYLAKRMNENQSDLLLVDTALVGWPDKHLIPEWCSMLPIPAAESAEARMYLHLYDGEKANKDFAAEMELARAGIITVRKLVHCGQIKKDKIKIIVSPLKVVRGVASTCRVVALED